MAGLHDLNYGRVGAMLTPTRFGNRPPDPSFRKVIKAYAIFSVDELKSHGMPLNDACRFLAKLLEQANIPIGARPCTPSWRTVKTWRNEVTRLGPNDQERHTLEALRAQCSFPQDMPIDELKKLVAQLLSVILPATQASLE